MLFYVLNGPNLDLLGVREPTLYGTGTLAALEEQVTAHAARRGVRTVCRQTNHEGTLVDWIGEAHRAGADGIVINPAAYTHTSIALLDAVKAVSLPTVEVHISDVNAREEFRRVSYIRAACLATVSGHGFAGYCEAVDLLLAHLAERGKEP